MFTSVLLYCCSQDNTKTNIDLLRDISGIEFAWNTPWIDVGAPEFQHSLVTGWQANPVGSDGTTSAHTQGPAVAIFHSFDHQDRTVEMRCKKQPAFDPSTIEIRVNGAPLSSSLMDVPNSGSENPHWITYSFPIPGSLIVRGENYLTLSTKTESTTGVSVDSFRFFDRFTKSYEPKQEAPRRVEHQAEQLIAVPVNSAIILHAVFQNDPEVITTYGLPPDAPESSAVRVSVRIETDDGVLQEASEILEKSRWQKAEGESVFSMESAFAQPARITLTVSAVEGKTHPRYVYWRKVLLKENVKPSIEPDKQETARGHSKMNVVVYVIDALRPDFLEPYGYTGSVSPRIREFAKEAVTFDNAYAVVSWTRAAVASILSGLYPSSHLTEDRHDALPATIPILPGELQEHDYRTFSVVTNPNLSPAMNFTRGYLHYRYLKEDKNTLKLHVQSDALYRQLEEVASEPGFASPVFLYVQAMDPHDPLTPAPEFQTPRPDCDYNDPSIFRPNVRIHGSKIYQNPKIVSCVRSLYESEVRQSDYYFGKFLDLLKRSGLYDDTLIVLTSDHGEALYEHGIWGHGQSLYESEIRVPLMIRFPNGEFRNHRSHSAVAHIDIFPTVLDYLKIALPPGIQGQSILPELGREPNRLRPLFSELVLDEQNWKSVRYNKHKFLETWRDGKRYYALFDLETDPFESVDLSDNRPVLLGLLKQLVKEWTHTQQKRRALTRKTKTGTIDAQTEEALKALGYLQ